MDEKDTPVQKATDTTVPAAYVAQFVDAFRDNLVIVHLAERMTYPEATAIADLLQVFGYPEAAKAWREEYDASDDEEAGDAGALITTH